MENDEVNKIPTEGKPDDSFIKEPNIVKIAKLALILADKDTDAETKRLCVMAAVRMEYITQEEANQLLLYRTELERIKINQEL